MARTRLTPEEVTAVNLATKGEKFSHRHWPPEVVRAVAAADVVKAGKGRRTEPTPAAARIRALRARLRAKLGGRRSGVAAGVAA